MKVKSKGRLWELRLEANGWFLYNRAETEKVKLANRRMKRDDAITIAKQYIVRNAVIKGWV